MKEEKEETYWLIYPTKGIRWPIYRGDEYKADQLSRKFSENLARSFANAERILDYLLGDHVVPTLEEFMKAGVNPEHLAKAYESMVAARQEPHIVVAPYGIGKEGWQKIFANATDDESIPNNPLRKQASGNGLRIEYGCYGQLGWRSLFDDLDDPKFAIDAPVVVGRDGISYTIRIISGEREPSYLNESYEDTKKEKYHNPPLIHQTWPEALTDKLSSILNGEIPSDVDYTYSWAQTADGYLIAPIVGWNKDSGQVHVTQSHISHRTSGYSRRGSRRAVW